MSAEKGNGVMNDLLQIGQLGKKVVSGLVSEVKTRVEEISQKAQSQAVSRATSATQTITDTIRNVSNELTRRTLLQRYNNLVSGGMSGEKAIEFIADKVKEELQKEKGL